VRVTEILLDKFVITGSNYRAQCQYCKLVVRSTILWCNFPSLRVPAVFVTDNKNTTCANINHIINFSYMTCSNMRSESLTMKKADEDVSVQITRIQRLKTEQMKAAKLD